MHSENIATSDNSDRIIYIDYLRILACFMVIVIHVSADKWGTLSPNLTSWKVMNFYDTMVRSAVPLFFMISGALFLRKDKLNLKKLYLHNILRLILIFVVWSVFYALGSRDIRTIIMSPLNYPIHMWFILSMIAIYLVLPFIFAAVKYDTGKYVGYMILIFLIFGIAQTTLRTIPYLSARWDAFDIQLCDYCGYFLLGYYLSSNNFQWMKKRYLLAAYFFGVILAEVLGVRYSLHIGKPSDIMMDIFIITTFIEAVAIFYLFKSENRFRMNDLVTSVSSCTLGIYLMHPFFIDRLESWFGISTLSFSPVVSIPVISISVFIICLTITLMIKKIPFIGKWLV